MLAKTKTSKKENRIIGLICGGGNLPLDIIEGLKKKNEKFFLLCFKGSADPKKIPSVYPQTWIRLGSGGAGIKALKKAGVTHLIFAGSVKRPDFTSLIPDFYTLKVLLKTGLRKQANDSLFKTLFKHLEEKEGFKILPVQNFVPDAVLKPGHYGYGKITKEIKENIEYGALCSYHIGICDAGQSVIIQQGIALALEGEDGTDAAIKRAAAIKHKGLKPILVKLPKPNQEMRVDLPVVGTGTLQTLKDSGFAGVALLEDGVMIVDKEEVFNMCKKYKIFIHVISHKDFEKIIKDSKYLLKK